MFSTKAYFLLEVSVSFVSAADSKEEQTLGRHVLGMEVKKRKRSETPLGEIRADDEVIYTEQEERAAKCADHDIDYEEKASSKRLQDSLVAFLLSRYNRRLIPTASARSSLRCLPSLRFSAY
jgi:hypothetical protein